MDINRKLYIMYHCPCLDGVFSLMSFMMPIITKIKLENWTIQTYLDHLINYLESLKLVEEKADFAN